MTRRSMRQSHAGAEFIGKSFCQKRVAGALGKTGRPTHRMGEAPRPGSMLQMKMRVNFRKGNLPKNPLNFANFNNSSGFIWLHKNYMIVTNVINHLLSNYSHSVSAR